MATLEPGNFYTVTVQGAGIASQYSDYAVGCMSKKSWLDFRRFQEVYFFSRTSGTVVEPNEPPAHWVPESCPAGKAVSRLIMCGAVPLLPLVPSCRAL